jgi:guanylate kinase
LVTHTIRHSTIAPGDTQPEPTVPDHIDPALQEVFQAGDESIAHLRAIRKPRVFIISGPSGVGKDAVLECLQNRYTNAAYVVTATTRAMRENETDGVHYLFYSKEDFLAGIERGDFLEHAWVYDNLYGVPRFTVTEGLANNRDVIIKVDVKGHATLRQKIANATSIFITPESTEALHRRLHARKTETLHDFLKRLRTASEELKRANEFDYVVFNEDDKLAECVEHICAIIDSEGRRVHQPDVTLK